MSGAHRRRQRTSRRRKSCAAQWKRVILLPEDPIIKKVVAAQLADCETSDEVEARCEESKFQVKKTSENAEAKTPPRPKIECYQEILSNHFIIDMLPEAISESVQKFFMSGGKI